MSRDSIKILLSVSLMISSSGDRDVNCTFKDAKKTVLLFAAQKNIWRINYIFKTSRHFFYNICSEEQNVGVCLVS